MTWPADAAAPRCARCGRRHGYDGCAGSHNTGPHATGPFGAGPPSGSHASTLHSGPHIPTHWTGQLGVWSSGVARNAPPRPAFGGATAHAPGDRERRLTGEHGLRSTAARSTAATPLTNDHLVGAVASPGNAPISPYATADEAIEVLDRLGEPGGWDDGHAGWSGLAEPTSTGLPGSSLTPGDRRWPDRGEPWPSVTTNPFGQDAFGAARRGERRERSRRASFGFPLQTHTPRRARRHTVEFARQWGLDDLVEAAELLVSELMTNTLEASYLSLGHHGVTAMVAPLELRLSAEAQRHLRIEVRDHNPQPPVLDDPDLDNERGRGLLLVDTYAELWGYHRLPTGGKVVWCVIGPPADDA